MSAWETRRLGDLTTKIGSGATPRGGKGVYQDDGTSFIRSQNVYDLRFDRDGLAHISEQAAESLKGVTVKSADVLLNITGESVTRTCLVDDAVLPARVSQHVAIVRAEPQRLDPVYLLYALINPPTKAMLNTLSQAGATRRALTKGHLEALEIPVPPLEEQERIAGVLGAFDDLIETNRRLIVSLGALQQAALTQADRTSATVGECADFLNRKRVPLSKAQRTANPGDYPYYGATGVMDSVGDYLFDGVHVLVGEDGTVVDAAGHPIVQVPHGKYWVNNHAHVLSGRTVSTDVLAVALRAANVGHVITGAVQAKLSMGNLKAVALDLPSDPGVRSALDSLGLGIRTIEDETADLTRQRDELLPLLMSGRVRVRDLEATVS